MVRLDLEALVAAAADLYRSSGDRTAEEAAELMMQASPHRPAEPPRALPVLAHLHAIALPPLAPGKAALLRDCAAHLPWTDGGFSLPAVIRGRNAYAELIGPDGPLASPHCRFGFYLQAPDCLYPAHSHAAEELYLILSGAPEWQVDEAEPFVPAEPGLVHHLPWQTHAMRTGSAPLFALWVWLGDIRYGTYSI
ncbi:MAG: dimethylsulfonioproprionate lyase family protein [Parvibaculaceae bacterium]